VDALLLSPTTHELFKGFCYDCYCGAAAELLVELYQLEREGEAGVEARALWPRVQRLMGEFILPGGARRLTLSHRLCNALRTLTGPAVEAKPTARGNDRRGSAGRRWMKRVLRLGITRSSRLHVGLTRACFRVGRIVSCLPLEGRKPETPHCRVDADANATHGPVR
jgi:hypothetical protein